MQSPDRPNSDNWLDTALRYDPLPVAEFLLTILWAFAIAAGLVAWCFG